MNSKNEIIKKILLNQIYYFSNIVLILTFIYKTKIRILNYLILFCSIILFHIYPNYYGIFKDDNNKLFHILLFADIIIHWFPIIYLYINSSNLETIDWNTSFIIVLIYLILFSNKIKEIYYDIYDDIKKISNQ